MMIQKAREARLRRFGHVQRMNSEHTARRMLRLKLPDRRYRRVSVREEDAEDLVTRGQMIGCGNPEGNSSKKNAMMSIPNKVK